MPFWKAPLCNLFPSLVIAGGSILGQYGFAMIFFGRLSQAAGVILMTINRLIAIVKPFAHELILDHKLTLALIAVVQVMAPLLYSLCSFVCSIDVLSTLNGTSARYLMDGECFGPIVNGIAGVFFMTGVGVVICYMVMLVKVIISDHHVHPYQVTSGSSPNLQRRLTNVAAMISGLLVVNCVLMFKVCQPEHDHVNHTCAMIRHGTEMVFSMSNPYIFYIMSTPVRENFVGIRKPHTPQSTRGNSRPIRIGRSTVMV